MLGDQIGEETGKVPRFRVLDAAGPKVEVTIQTKGKLLGSDYQGLTTYWSGMRPGGFLYGKGQGIYMTADSSMGMGRTREQEGSLRTEAQVIVAQFIS